MLWDILREGGRIMRKILILVAMLIVCAAIGGCGQTGSSQGDSMSGSNKDERWTYEKLEEEFGGIIETDCLSVIDCLSKLSQKNYCVSGYIIKDSDFSYKEKKSKILTISDNKSDNENSKETITASCDALPVAITTSNEKFLYFEGENLDPSIPGTYHLSGSAYSKENGDNEYLSIAQFLMLMEKIYSDTYFKTEGIIMQDGEDIDGNPRYYLYPSEESYKQRKYSRIDLEFQKEYSNLNGKHVVIMGNPDNNPYSQGLNNCNIVGGDSVE